jgi:cellulose synthase/poly-beta-1,6-N-acetylglucosamine synthase-like glycosyltransferase
LYWFAVIITLITSAVGIEWLVRNFLAFPVWRRAFHLGPDYSSGMPPDPPPPVSIVVAARDEEENIEQCVEMILAQDYPELELIVVDDRSSDSTGEIIDRLATVDTRMRAMHIRELPEGWCGKNHAMQAGIAEAKHDWIAMTDADCRLHSRAMITSVMRYAGAEGADMVSLLPTLEAHSFWERLLLPVCGGMLMIWFPPKKVSDPSSKRAFANGQFMLIRREAYEAVGTHEAIKGSLIEDIDLARNIKLQQMSLRFAPTRDLFRVRMYSSLEEIVRGWTRIFIGSFRRLHALLAALGVLLGRGLTLTVITALGWAMAASGAQPDQWWLACAMIATVSLATQLVMTCRFYKHARLSWAYGLAYPFTALVISGILLKTICKLRPGGKITWRDTVYHLKNR